jgi:hypothetical protein
MITGEGYSVVSSPNSRANTVATPTRLIQACKKVVAVHDEDNLDSDDEDMDNDEPNIMTPHRARKNTHLLCESLIVSHCDLKERHITTRTDLKYLKREHESEVK